MKSRLSALGVLSFALLAVWLFCPAQALTALSIGTLLGTLIFVENGEQKALANIVNLTAPQNLVLRLYTNNHTPGNSDAVGAYTEASGDGYSAITLTGSSWNAPTGGAPATITYALQTYTFTGNLGNVYGYYCTRASGADLMIAEIFSNGPYDVQNNGDTISITPTITGN